MNFLCSPLLQIDGSIGGGWFAIGILPWLVFIHSYIVGKIINKNPNISLFIKQKINKEKIISFLLFFLVNVLLSGGGLMSDFLLMLGAATLFVFAMYIISNFLLYLLRKDFEESTKKFFLKYYGFHAFVFMFISISFQFLPFFVANFSLQDIFLYYLDEEIRNYFLFYFLIITVTLGILFVSFEKKEESKVKN